MKKMIEIAFRYAIAALIGGVFFREFTKFNDFTEATALGKVHTHLFMLGMFFFLLAAIFEKQISLTKQKLFQKFMLIYNAGVILTTIMMVVRGITEVRKIALSSGMNASISGIAGIGHVLTGVGIILYFLTLKKAAADN